MKKTYNEWITCPECGMCQEATVEVGVPWNIRIHECEQCEYIIQESEWEKDEDKCDYCDEFFSYDSLTMDDIGLNICDDCKIQNRI